MARVVDITDKLSFDENPTLVVEGKKLEVNADAPTLLKVMSLLGNKEPGIDEILEAYNLIFSEKAKKGIEALKPSFGDMVIIIQEAVSLVTGGVSQGEH
ncbi:hypothetical protein [Clostridium sp.]